MESANYLQMSPRSTAAMAAANSEQSRAHQSICETSEHPYSPHLLTTVGPYGWVAQSGSLCTCHLGCVMYVCDARTL